MNKIQDPLVREVVDNIIGEFPDGFLGNNQTEENKNFEDALKDFASVQFIALFSQLNDNKSNNIKLLNGEIEKLSIKLTRLQQQIDEAVDNPDLRDFEKFHNELIQSKTEKLMTELMLKKINPTSEIKNTAIQIKEELQPPEEHAPQAPQKRASVATPSSKASQHGKPGITPPPVPPRETRTTRPPVPPRESRSGLPPVPSRENRPELTSNPTRDPTKPPKRPTASTQTITTHRQTPLTPTRPNSTNKKWAQSAEKMAASLKQNASQPTSTPHPRRKSIEEAAADLKLEKAEKAKLAAHRRKDFDIPKG